MKVRETKAITLVALIITIIILLLLAGATITTLSNIGLFSKAKQAENTSNKSQATELLKLKMAECQIQSIGEKKTNATLAYLAAFLENDKKTVGDIEYVEAESKALADLNETAYLEWNKIYTKLAKYPYEFEIDTSLKVTIAGEEVVIPSGYMKIPTETKEITISENGTTTEDIKDFANVKINVDVKNQSGAPELLWTNPKPNSNFAAQTIPLDLSEYKYVIVTTKHKVDVDYLPRTAVIVPVGDYSNLIGLGKTNSWEERTVRYARASSSGVYFTLAYWGGDSPYQNYVIPLKIYGLKGEMDIDIYE